MTLSDPEPRAKFLLGIICSSEDDPGLPVRKFNQIMDVSLEKLTQYPFEFTEYYESEFGEELVRHWYGADALKNPARLLKWKLRAMELESETEDETGDRRFNLDPGYVTGAKFVLASRKNHAHRIYLGEGVYAEVTLRFENGEWRTMPKSYPEFRDDTDRDWLDTIRKQWKQAISDSVT